MKTRVLLSSIFFIADSVVSGYLRMEYWSSGLTFGTDLREYLGLRSSRSVFGLWNLVVYRLVTVDFLETPARSLAAFFALSASLPVGNTQVRCHDSYSAKRKRWNQATTAIAAS